MIEKEYFTVKDQQENVIGVVNTSSFVSSSTFLSYPYFGTQNRYYDM